MSLLPTDGPIRRIKMKSKNLLEEMTRELVKELEASGRKVTKSRQKQNKVTINFKPKIRKNERLVVKNVK